MHTMNEARNVIRVTGSMPAVESIEIDTNATTAQLNLEERRRIADQLMPYNRLRNQTQERLMKLAGQFGIGVDQLLAIAKEFPPEYEDKKVYIVHSQKTRKQAGARKPNKSSSHAFTKRRNT